MISKDDYLYLVKRFVTNGFIKPGMLNVDLGQVSPVEQGFIYSITKETLASKIILEGIQFNELGPLEKHMFFDSQILNFLSSKPEPEQFNQNQEFLQVTEGALQLDPESIIGLYARIYQVLYRNDYKEAIQLLEMLRKQVALNDKLTYLLIMSYHYFGNIAKAKHESLKLRPSFQKLVNSLALFYFGSIFYRIASGLILMLCVVFIDPFWVPILIVFLLDIFLIPIGFFFRNKVIISLGIVDILAKAIMAGLGLLGRYLFSTL